jgi:hypothetical protein
MVALLTLDFSAIMSRVTPGMPNSEISLNVSTSISSAEELGLRGNVFSLGSGFGG